MFGCSVQGCLFSFSSVFFLPPRDSSQGVKAEKKMVDGKQVDDYWAASKKVH